MNLVLYYVPDDISSPEILMFLALVQDYPQNYFRLNSKMEKDSPVRSGKLDGRFCFIGSM